MKRCALFLPDDRPGRKFSTSSFSFVDFFRAPEKQAFSVLLLLIGACAPPPGPSPDGSSNTQLGSDGNTPAMDASSSNGDSQTSSNDANQDGTVSPGMDSANTMPPGGSQLGPERAGLITYYDADGTGNCSFDRVSGPLLVAAMNTPEWNNSAVCGMCVRVTGPRGSVVVRIVDRCPECQTGHLDMSREAFAAVADPVQGRVNVRWQPVRCEVQGPLSYRFKEGSSQWWTGFQVRNHRVPIRTFEVNVNNTWRALERQDYNYFIGTNLGPGPFRARITAQDGQVLEEPSIPLRDATVVMGTVQFN